jgi:transcriptional regulator with XRE-family HTH domain
LRRVNKLKFFIRQKQAAYKRETGKNLPQVAIAVALGIDPATLSQYANNKIGSVNWEIWEKLADYFGVSGDEIFNVLPDDKAK